MIEEALESFIRQDYKGEKELIIVNDFEKQIFHFNHPEVKIFNFKRKIKTLGMKRNIATEIASGEYILPWDDDDIHLPNRISWSVKSIINSEEEFVICNKTYDLQYNNELVLDNNGYPSTSIFTKNIFNKVNGYPVDRDAGEDNGLISKISNIKIVNITLSDVFYIYRRLSGNIVHLTTLGRNKAGTVSGGLMVQQIIDKFVKEKKIPTGEIALTPAWQRDYIKDVNSLVYKLQKNKI